MAGVLAVPKNIIIRTNRAQTEVNLLFRWGGGNKTFMNLIILTIYYNILFIIIIYI